MGNDFPCAMDHLDLDNGTGGARIRRRCHIPYRYSVMVASRQISGPVFDGAPAITPSKTSATARTAYVGARLGREGLAKSLPVLLEELGIDHWLRTIAVEVLRVDMQENWREPLVFPVPPTHDVAVVDVEGEPLGRLAGPGANQRVRARPPSRTNGVLVVKVLVKPRMSA